MLKEDTSIPKICFRFRLGDDNVTQEFTRDTTVAMVYKSVAKIMNRDAEYSLFIPSLRQKLDQTEHKKSTIESLGIIFDTVVMVQCSTQKRFIAKSEISKKQQQINFFEKMDEHSKNQWGRRLDGKPVVPTPTEYRPPSEKTSTPSTMQQIDISQVFRSHGQAQSQARTTPQQGKKNTSSSSERRTGIHTMRDI